MSTVAEIQKAIAGLSDTEWQAIKDWLNARPDPRQFTEDGFDLRETSEILRRATAGPFRVWTEDDWRRLEESAR